MGCGGRPSFRVMVASLRNSLRGRLIVLVALVAVASCLLAGLLIWRAYNNERDAVFRELGATARAVALLVDQRVETLESLLEGLVTAPELEKGDLQSFYARAAKITKKNRRWVVVSEPDGQQVINTRVPFGTDLPYVEPAPDIEEVMAQGRVYVSNLFQGAVAGGPVLFVSAGVFEGPAMRHRVSLVVTPDEFQAGLDTSSIAPGYVVAVVDRNGVIAARNRSADSFVGRGATPDIAAAAASRREMLAESTTIEGVRVFAAIAPALHSGWSVALGTPVAQLHASTKRLLLLGLLTSVGILAAATLVAWWIARAAFHDVSAVVADTQAIAKGAAPVRSATVLAETSFIAESLRTMAAQLHRELDERRRAEAESAAAKEALSRANAELECKVQERTASLTELVGQMEEFSYSVSHDLRAPVRAMTGLAEVLMEDCGPQLGAEGRAILDRIIGNGGRMDRLINELLTFSRISRQNVELVPVDLEAVLIEAIADHPGLSRHAAAISIERPLPPVLAHAPSLGQALTNLLVNAIKFVPPGREPKVRIASEEYDGVARLWICDNGIGIAPQFHHRLFRVFERVHVTGKFEGSGIGLAIVRRAIERMDGRVGVESDGINGSRFWIELKRVRNGTAPGEA